MNLEGLCATIEALDLPAAGVAEHPDREVVLAARAAATEAVADDEFLIDCVGHELDLLVSHSPRRSLVPFYTLPGSGVGLAFGYHPPGGRPGAHEHTAWTITAVWRNALEMATFDRAESYKRQALVPKNIFQAEAGRVGFVYDPCIHEPRNPTSQWTLSLHIISPRDGERPEDDIGPPPPGLGMRRRVNRSDERHPYIAVMAARQQDVYARELLRAVADVPGDRADRLRERCLAMTTSPTRRQWAGEGSGVDDPERSAPTWTLTRTHADLELGCQPTADGTALYAVTPAGAVEELVVNDVAQAAIAMTVRETGFAVHDLPGNLSAEERRSLADALEESGLFRWRQL